MAVTSTIENPALVRAERRSPSWSRLTGSDRLWALAFATPYVLVFFAFVIYPICYGLWLGSDPATYRQLFADPVYPSALLNTLIYLLVAVNLEAVPGAVAVGLLHAQGLVDQDLAADLHPALGRARDPGLHLDPLDAQRPMGSGEQCDLEPVAGRRPALARQRKPRARLRDLRAYLEMAALLDHHLSGRPHGHPDGALRGRQGRRRQQLRPLPAHHGSACWPASIWSARC